VAATRRSGCRDSQRGRRGRRARRRTARRARRVRGAQGAVAGGGCGCQREVEQRRARRDERASRQCSARPRRLLSSLTLSRSGAERCKARSGTTNPALQPATRQDARSRSLLGSAVHDRGADLLVLVLADPELRDVERKRQCESDAARARRGKRESGTHLVESAERGKDGPAEPRRVAALGGRGRSICARRPKAYQRRFARRARARAREGQSADSRILTFVPGAIAPSSAWRRSTKPGMSVVPPVTTTLASRVACRSGSTWTRVDWMRRARG